MVVLLWISTLFLLYKNGLLTLDIEHIQKVLEENKHHAMSLFVLLFSIRVFLFLPSLPFMIMGGLLFGQWKGFCLSIIGITVSLSIVYVTSIMFSESAWIQKIKRKHSRLMPVVEKYNHRFLAVGILAPVANTDAVCLLSTFTGISYQKYILTAVLVNIPTALLYSLLGNTYNTSITGMIAVSVLSVFNFLLGIYILWKIKGDRKKEKK